MKKKRRPFVLLVQIAITLLILVISSRHMQATADTFENIIVPEGHQSEEDLLNLYMDSLQRHVPYAEDLWHDYSTTLPDSGYFGRGTCDEFGIRTATYYAYIYAFLYEYSPNDTISGVPKAQIRDRAIQSIHYLIGTHINVDAAPCPNGGGNGAQWGLVWQSSMWTTRLGMAAWMLMDELSVDTQNQIKTLIADEADFIAARTPPHNLDNDTKAEENGWDSNIVSLATSLMPGDARSAVWDDKAQEFMMNTLSVEADLTNPTIVNGKPISEWVHGPNLYPDFSSENHSIFHPVYIMVPIGELGNSAVTYAYGGKPVPETIEHHVLDVWNNVLQFITLADGEWIYPNGLDWMIHDYEHLSTLAWLATYFDDSAATLLESRAASYLSQRQQLNTDGSYFGELNDVAELREAVQAARVIDSYFYHLYWGGDSTPATSWDEIENALLGTQSFVYSDIFLHRTQSKVDSFSWQNKIMGVIVPQSKTHLETPYVTLPYQSGLVGKRSVVGEVWDNEVITYTINMQDDLFATTGSLLENQGVITHHLAYVSLPGHASVYFEKLLAAQAVQITLDQGIPVGIEMDAMSGITRTLYSEEGAAVVDGLSSIPVSSGWMNLDDRFGLIVHDGDGIFFEQSSIIRGALQSLLYGSYNDGVEIFNPGDEIADRKALILSDVDHEMTAQLATQFVDVPLGVGLSGAFVGDVDHTWLIMGNFWGNYQINETLWAQWGGPVITGSQVISASGINLALEVAPGTTEALPVNAFVETPVPVSTNWVSGGNEFSITNFGVMENEVTVTYLRDGQALSGVKTLLPGVAYFVDLQDGSVVFYTKFFLPVVAQTSGS